MNETINEKTGEIITLPEKVNPATFNAESMIALAINKGVDVATMERLLAMRKELKTEFAHEAFNQSLAKFQSECPVIQKTKHVRNKDNTLRYSYAPLEAIVKQVGSVLQQNGFSYTLDAKVEEGWVTAICKAIHENGHSETSSFQVPIDKNSYMNAPQQFASALTFAKRYAFCNSFGIMTGDEDDDSNQNNGQQPKKPRESKSAPKVGKLSNLVVMIDQMFQQQKRANNLEAFWKALQPFNLTAIADIEALGDEELAKKVLDTLRKAFIK